MAKVELSLGMESGTKERIQNFIPEVGKGTAVSVKTTCRAQTAAMLYQYKWHFSKTKHATTTRPSNCTRKLPNCFRGVVPYLLLTVSMSISLYGFAKYY